MSGLMESIIPNVLYLMQGQLYDIYGKRIFTRAVPHISE